MNWTQFLDDNNIPYVTRGPNTKRGEISIKCPYCGEDDPSEHLGINLTLERWGCHRNPGHRGKQPTHLVQTILGGSWAQAKLVVAQYSVADPETLDAALIALNGTSEAPRPKAGPPEAPEWQAIKRNGSTGKFFNYLKGRGFDDVDDLINRYKIKCCLTGRFKDRVIIPFYHNNLLVGWTGRALGNPTHAPRYLSSGEGIKTTVFNEDELHDGGKMLVVVEGPFDALKMDYYGEPFGVRATCGFGTSLSPEQLTIIIGVRRRFKRVVILFDHDAVEPSFHAADWLQAPNVSIGSLPPGTKDPGAMKRDDIEALITAL